MNYLSKNFVEFAEKHSKTILIIVLIAGNVYQYIHAHNIADKVSVEIKALHDKNVELNIKNLEYERNRSERFEYLLNTLSRTQSPVIHGK